MKVRISYDREFTYEKNLEKSYSIHFIVEVEVQEQHVHT